MLRNRRIGVLLLGLLVGCQPSAPQRGGYEEAPHAEAEELAPYMAAMQRYAEKLYFAGEAGNWPLAAFYVHELEEGAEAVIGGAFEEDGVALTPLVESILVPSIEAVEVAVAEGQASSFAAAYAELVASCNQCHQSSAHGFVEIIVPSHNPYPSQRFAPQE